MAAWQFDLTFAHGATVASWRPASRSQVMHELADRLGPSTPMLDGWRYFGDEAGNRVDMLSDREGTCRLYARLDAGAGSTDHFIVRVCQVAAGLGCDFFSEELSIILHPNPRALRAALQQSAAWQFALDPEAFQPRH